MDVTEAVPTPKRERGRPPRENLGDRPQFCIFCGVQLNEDRIRQRASTCSPEHAALRKHYLKNRVERRRCTYCGAASTPAQRAQFKRWRVLQNRIAKSPVTALLTYIESVIEGTADSYAETLKAQGVRNPKKELLALFAALLDQEPRPEDETEEHHDEEVTSGGE